MNKNLTTFNDYLSYCNQYKIDITKWNSVTLAEKLSTKKSLTEAELCAVLFFNEMNKSFK